MRSAGWSAGPQEGLPIPGYGVISFVLVSMLCWGFYGHTIIVHRDLGYLIDVIGVVCATCFFCCVRFFIFSGVCWYFGVLNRHITESRGVRFFFEVVRYGGIISHLPLPVGVVFTPPTTSLVRFGGISKTPRTSARASGPLPFMGSSRIMYGSFSLAFGMRSTPDSFTDSDLL